MDVAYTLYGDMSCRVCTILEREALALESYSISLSESTSSPGHSFLVSR